MVLLKNGGIYFIDTAPDDSNTDIAFLVYRSNTNDWPFLDFYPWQPSWSSVPYPYGVTIKELDIEAGIISIKLGNASITLEIEE